MDGKLCYSIPEAGRALGVSRATVYVLIKDGDLASIRVGGRRLVTAQALRDFIDCAQRTERCRPTV
jgi:excisionase family DNA binding protein